MDKRTMLIDNLTVNCISDFRCILGEGPMWDYNKSLLYWVDILECKIYRYDPFTHEITKWETPEYIGFLIINKESKLIAGLRSGLHYIDLNKDGTTTVIRIDKINEGLENVRFNDGIIDNHGGIWACSMDMNSTEKVGCYYYYDKNLKRTQVDKNYTVANGPAVSNDCRFLYTVETVGNNIHKKGIYCSQIVHEGKTENKKLLIDWSQLDSYPDGIITDRNGNLWIGEFGGNKFRCFSNEGILKYTIQLPAWNLTKGVFCDKDDDILYITSASIGVSKEIIDKNPKTGYVFEIKGIQHKRLQ
ncbi:SMP-30/gluconolactonase/LRE family protein [Pedobacter sp. Du54]|uniref:SMP-30/gluconolactonase/LRE family protein n=1 Tax=Pedobacter anseongensis TaxID=3133439 RepID=UPI0030AFEF15